MKLPSLALFIALAGATGASAAEPSAVLKAVDACRAITDDNSRLSCFDKAAAGLAAAQAKGDVVVIDREQVRAARKEAFGFDLPKLSLLGRGATPAAAEADDDDTATFTIESASKGRDGRWVVIMTNGAVWRQTNDPIGAMAVRKGDTAAVRKGALGAYFMNIGRYRAIKVERAR